MKIESLQNKKVKEWKKLQEKKYRDAENIFLIEGDHLLKEALASNCVKEIISSDKIFQIEEIPFYEVTEEILKKCSKQASGTNVLAVCGKKAEKEIKGNVCILDNIQDPGNLGTIIRSCVAFNIDTLIASTDTVDFYNEKVIRASEGMIFHLNIIKKDIEETINELHENGYIIYGTNVKNGKVIKQMTPPPKYAIIMGNEGTGVKEEIEKMCDENLYIPINKKCESLNVGVATSIILYELGK